jgi:hypothetical protein
MTEERRKDKRFTNSYDSDLMCCDTIYATINHVKDFTKETIVEIFLKVPEIKAINLVCKARWFSDKTTDHGETFCLGLEIIKPPEEYTALLESME